MSITGGKTDGNGLYITLCGAYGAGNLGDEASLEQILAALREKYPAASFCVITRSPEETAARYGADAVHSFAGAGIMRALKRSDALIFGGGSLFQTVTSRRSLYYYLELMRDAKSRGCAIVCWGCGIGPLDKRSEKLTARVLDACADLLCLRDEKSLAYLRSLGVTEPELQLTADPVLRLVPRGDADAFLRDNGVCPDGKTVCFIVRPWKDAAYTEAVRKAAELLQKEGCTPVFAVLCRGDAELTKSIAGDFACLPYTEDAALMAAVLGKMRCVVSVRLHGLVLAALTGTRCVGIDYDPKISAFTERIGSRALPIDKLCPEELKNAVLCAGPPEHTEECKTAEKGNLSFAAKIMERKRLE